MDDQELFGFVSDVWDNDILPTLTEYIAIPNVSPVFEENLCYFAPHGHGAEWAAAMNGCHSPRLDVDNISCDLSVTDPTSSNFCAPENINIDYPPKNEWIRISAFIICSGMAAVSGILAASYTGKVSPGSGGGNELLYAVGAAVIGGTSLFGGRGRAIDAVIGGLVIATIPNGLGLLDQASYINFIVTGGVLLLAASVDAISRRRRSASGV